MFVIHRLVLYIAICCFLLPLASVNAGERERVDVSFSVQAIQIQDSVSARLSAKAEWALVAVNLETGDRLVSAGSATTPLVPGSLLKLFVTAVILGQNTREAINLSTVISVSGEVKKGKLLGNVILKGAGNPFLSTKDLQEAVDKIKLLGIKEISGDIIIDDSLFDVKDWKTRYAGPAYATPSALGLDMHTVSISADGSGGRIVIDPLNDAVKVSINPSGKPGVRQIDDITYEITGVKPDAPAVRKRFSLEDPGLYVGGTFATLLKRAGITVAGTVKRGKTPSPQSSPHRGEDKSKGKNKIREIARVGSTDIQSVVIDTNRYSLNVAADNMLFLLGSLKHGTPGTREKGAQAVNDFLNSMNVPTTGMVIDDGGGISPRNRISADQMTAFLRAAEKRSWFPVFSESLSRPGMDGRLQDMNYRSDRIRAKTGEVYGAYGLAGYVDQPGRGKIAFAYMVNGASSDVEAAKAGAGDLLRRLEQLR